METLQEVAVETQAAHPPAEIQSGRKGVEIVISAALPRRCFYGPRPGRNFPVRDANEDWSQRVAVAMQ